MANSRCPTIDSPCQKDRDCRIQHSSSLIFQVLIEPSQLPVIYYATCLRTEVALPCKMCPRNVEPRAHK
jgi:hypothetical protein